MKYQKLYAAALIRENLLNKEIEGLKKHLRTEKNKNRIYRKKLYEKIIQYTNRKQALIMQVIIKKHSTNKAEEKTVFDAIQKCINDDLHELSRIFSDLSEALNCIK